MEAIIQEKYFENGRARFKVAALPTAPDIQLETLVELDSPTDAQVGDVLAFDVQHMETMNGKRFLVATQPLVIKKAGG